MKIMPMNEPTPRVSPCTEALISPSRRAFLRFSGFLLAAPAMLTGCGGRGGSGDQTPMTTCALAESDPAEGTPIYLADYEPPAFFVDEIELTLDIGPDVTRV